MNDIRQINDDGSAKNYDQNLAKLNDLNLREENEVSEQDKCTPTLDYLQVPTINGDILWLDTIFIFYFFFIIFHCLFSLLLKSCIRIIKIHQKIIPKRYL